MEDKEGHADSADNAAWRMHVHLPVRSRASVLLIPVVAALAFGLSACGGGFTNGLRVAGSGSTTTTVAALAGQATNASNAKDELAYARCMRAHDEPNFPDPSASGGFELGAGVDPSSPAFKAAQAKCQQLLPGGGAPGSGPPPTAQALAQMLKVSECMRRHGISDFPDPRTSLPSNRSGIGVIADRDGVILVFSLGFDEQSPQFTHAAGACGFKLTNH